MLMQNFKSAADLGITEPQKEALMKTLVLLETGRLEYVPRSRIKDIDFAATFCGKFNMRYWVAESNCGPVATLRSTPRPFIPTKDSDWMQP